MSLFLLYRVAGLLPADVLEVALRAVLVPARDALDLDRVWGVLGGLLDFAVDLGPGLADDRLAVGGADVDLGALLVELGPLLGVHRLAVAGLVLRPPAHALAALLVARPLTLAALV